LEQVTMILPRSVKSSAGCGLLKTTVWIAITLLGQERSPQPPRQEANCRLRQWLFYNETSGGHYGVCMNWIDNCEKVWVQDRFFFK